MTHFPIIVLEGPDGTGKTTLGQRLATKVGGHYMHLTYRFPKAMFDYHTAAIEIALRHAERHPVILDRWWPSEQVYAAAFRGGSPWPMAGRMLDRVGLKHGITYVLCIPDDRESYLDHYRHTKSRDENVLGDRGRIYDAYMAWEARMSGRRDLTTYNLLTEGSKLNLVMDMIIERAWIYSQVPAHFDDRLDRRFAGNPTGAKYLLVGDQSKPKTRRAVWPFFDHSNSSLWAAQRLELAGVRESELAWANAHDAEGKLQLKRAEVQSYNWQIIALGNMAFTALSELKVPVSLAMNHPQYYRRFKPQENPFRHLGPTSGEEYVKAGRDLCVA